MTRWIQPALWVLLGLFIYALVMNAWVADDAYITFRTVDNLVNGHGLTWNPGERVQVYSHPLWMLLISVFYFVTGEPFYTAIIVSILLSLAAVAVIFRALRRQGDTWRTVLLLIALLSSKAFMDYTASGLENPLSYLLAALFFASFLFSPWSEIGILGSARGAGDSKSVASTEEFDAGLNPLHQMEVESRHRQTVWLFFLAALAFVTRQDTILLYLPAVVWTLWTIRSRWDARLFFRLAAALSPAVLWLSFSLVYYGSFFPNTAYAKLINSGIPATDRLLHGLAYFANSAAWDGASVALGLGAMVLAIRVDWRPAHLAMAGVGLYIGYVIASAATATHMSGRFLALPYFVAILVLVRLLPRRAAVWVGAAAGLWLVLWPLSSLRAGTPAYRPAGQFESFIDTRSYVHNEGASLLRHDRARGRPAHPWYLEGERFARAGATVHLGGASGGEGIGYFGYAAGPEKRIIDYVALADPFLARLPACNTARRDLWKAGHFYRLLPEGYAPSGRRGRVRLQDPELAEYEAHLAEITRGPLLDGGRLLTILKMNLGIYDHLLEGYRTRVRALYANTDCRTEVRAAAGPVR